jgi:phosphatidylcholine synthase
LTLLDYARAFSVHVLTASGAALALGALLAAVRGAFDVMFLCLGIALIVDGIDGTIARAVKVAAVLPRWSGDILDLVVDFVTYVFVPAYAIAAGGLLPLWLGVPAGIVIVITGAIYFADRRMKTADNHFRGFPGLWNIAAFYLFLLHPVPALGSLGVLILIALTFAPFHFVHPVRVIRLRWLTLTLVSLGGVLAIYTLVNDFEVGLPVTIALCAIGLYVVGSDAAIRLVRSLKA